MAEPDRALTQQLEDTFRRLTMRLYDTSVPAEVLDDEVRPYLAEDVTFIDPWQQGSGRRNYRLGAAGFHCMFRFDFELAQVNVMLADDQRSGRAIVDGVMQLRQFAPLLVYPLRTILVYEFTLVQPADGGAPPLPVIHRHEEMWSFADMLAAMPGLGAFYSKVFRPLFTRGFLRASLLCRKRRQAVPLPPE